MVNITGLGGTPADVDGANQILIKTNDDPTKVGLSRVVSTVDESAGLFRSPDVSADSRVRVGADAVLDSERFIYAAQNTAKHFYNASVQTMGLGTGFLRTNSGASTAISGSTFRTRQVFPRSPQLAPLHVDFVAAINAPVTTNTSVYFGLFTPNAATPFAPTDGAFFRIGAILEGVCMFNGAESSVTLALPLLANQNYQFLIVIGSRSVEFWIDDVLYGTVAAPANSPSGFSSTGHPVAITHAITGVAGAAFSLLVASYSVLLGDMGLVMPFDHLVAVSGGSIQGQSGGVMGGLTQAVNGTAPAVVALTASTAPALNFLGSGFIWPVAVAIGESDYPILAWQNPAGSATQQPKTFYATGLLVGDMGVSTAAVGGPLMVQWFFAYGATAASLATAESATFAANTTKAPRRLLTGVVQTVPAAATVGTVIKGGVITFPDPIVIHPGEFAHVIARVFGGVATTAGAIRQTVQILGHFDQL